MEFTEVRIYTTTAGIEPVAGLLEDAGIEGYVLEDAADFEAFLQDTAIYWDYVDDALLQEKRACETCLKAYLTQDEQGGRQLALLREGLARLHANDPAHLLGRLALETGLVRQEDWEWGWKQYFKPFPVGETFLVKPSWETCDVPDGRMVLEIDPASSFGTGSHETTQLCLLALEKQVRPGDRMLDMGTGSGILAIAAAKLGAQVDAIVDIDENCLRCARENAARNQVVLGEGFAGDAARDHALAAALGREYRLITANIVADVILSMAGLFFEKLSSGGVLICSGVLTERADEVEDGLRRAGLQVHSRNEQGDWAAFTAQKP